MASHWPLRGPARSGEARRARGAGAPPPVRRYRLNRRPKQQLAPIVIATAADLLPLHAKMHDSRRQAFELISQASVDRAALESLRAEKINLVELGSRRLTQALMYPPKTTAG